MQDHNLSIDQGKSDGKSSVGLSNDTKISSEPATSGLDPHRPWGCFAERAFRYVDCYFARNGFTGRAWSKQLYAECEQRHQDFLNITAARRAFGPAVIPYGLMIRSILSSSRVLHQGPRAFGDESADGERTCSSRRFSVEVTA